MAKEAEDQDPNAENGEEQVEGPMFSKKGKLVLLIVVALQFVLFALAFYFSTKPEDIPQALQEVAPEKNVKDLNGPRIEITQPIIISIPTNELATEFRHLAIELVIVVGRVEDEWGDPSFDLIGKLTEEQFLETAENFKPWISDRANKIANDYSYLELQKETTKSEFKRRLKEELNNILESYGMKPRFQEILLTRFIFSD
jgi:flagellar basal body-associated protein FliL